MRKLTWEQQPEALLNELGLTRASANTVGIPVTSWVANASGLIVQMRLDLSAWAGQLVAAPTNLAVTSLILTEVHQQIDLSYLPGSGSRFRFTPTTGSQSVGRFDLPAPNWAALTSPRQSFAKAIPARLALAPASLLDLTPYYNASLQKTWHDNNTGNNLAALPRGLLQFSDVLFDVRGLVQLASQRLRNPRNRLECPQRRPVPGTPVHDHLGKPLAGNRNYFAGLRFNDDRSGAFRDPKNEEN